MRRLFDRNPGRQAQVFAQAQALLDDGLDVTFVLELFAEDADWLTPLLHTSRATQEAVAAEAPSYYFEASLKAKFLAAGAAAARERRNEAPVPPALVPEPAPGGFARLRAAAAGFTVVGASLALGVLTLGFVTAESAVPGDWNYSLKMAQERLQYTLSSGDQRVDVQLRQTEARVYELQRQASKGNVSAAAIERLQREASELAQLATKHPLDEVQKARLKSIGEASSAILTDVGERRAALQPKAKDTIDTVNNAVAAGTGISVNPLPTPAADPATPPVLTPTEPPATATTAEPTEPGTVEPSTPEPPTTTPTDTDTATPTGTAEATVSPSPSPTSESDTTPDEPATP